MNALQHNEMATDAFLANHRYERSEWSARSLLIPGNNVTSTSKTTHFCVSDSLWTGRQLALLSCLNRAALANILLLAK